MIRELRSKSFSQVRLAHELAAGNESEKPLRDVKPHPESEANDILNQTIDMTQKSRQAAAFNIPNRIRQPKTKYPNCRQ